MQLTDGMILRVDAHQKRLPQEARHFRNGEEMKYKPTAFDDRELRDWLMDLIADGSQNFICALAEVAVIADAEDYGVIRPALVEFRRKYRDRTWKRVASRRFVTTQGTSSETQSARGQKQ